MKINSALSHYLNSLANETTKVNYRIVLEDFLEEIENLNEITREVILSYKGTLVGKAPQTVAARLAAIRSFCDYCWTQGWTTSDPSLAIKNIPVEKYGSAKNISFEDFKKILSQADLFMVIQLLFYVFLLTMNCIRHYKPFAWNTRDNYLIRLGWIVYSLVIFSLTLINASMLNPYLSPHVERSLLSI
jgi:integrase